jgi:hypothetical protein
MRKSISRTRSRWIRAGITTGAIAAIVIAAATPAQAVAATVTLSAITGPSAGGNTLTATSTTAFLSGYTTPGAAFTVPACPTTYSTTTVTPTSAVGYVPALVVKKLSNLKGAITVPAGVVTVGSAATTKYNVCVYGTQTAGSALVGTATYTVAVAPNITSISPTSGPAQGGSTVTVTGTGFPTTAGSITASIGGSSLLNITPVSSTSFTAVTPTHAPGTGLTLSIGTTAGTLNKTNYYAYTNGIVIGPNTGPNTADVDIDIQGVGYLSLDFTTTDGSTPNDTNGHVYLANGTYSAVSSSGKTNGEVTECINVIVVSDTELICTLKLTQALNAYGLGLVAAHANTTRTVTDAVTAAASPTITSATAAFSATDIGTAVTNPTASFATGLYIIAVGSASSATLSANAGAIAGAGSVTTIGGPRTVTTGTLATSGSPTLGSTALFYSADAGRTITDTTTAAGAGAIPPNTTISAFGTTSSVTLSHNTTAAISGATLTIGQPYPVTTDTYTVTVVDDGGIGATVSQSIVSSGATFTVAPY